jgi:hypothetical protein
LSNFGLDNKPKADNAGDGCEPQSCHSNTSIMTFFPSPTPPKRGLVKYASGCRRQLGSPTPQQ